LVVSLSGAHAYGFPSPDSDLDLKAVHIDPTRQLLGLGRPHVRAERLEVLDGVEVDYSSNELQAVLIGILHGNGNFIERILGAIPLRSTPDLDVLRPIVRRSLSRKIHRHYRGFAAGQLEEWNKAGGRSAKKLLYVLRTTLTGTHALKGGTIVTDLTHLIDEYGFGEARELVDQKRKGELAELREESIERWRLRVGRTFELLDTAREDSQLPEEPPNPDELEDWLFGVRRQRF
jgi:predicted nucleotidyltransferase